jgi:hypothetical protein
VNAERESKETAKIMQGYLRMRHGVYFSRLL